MKTIRMPRRWMALALVALVWPVVSAAQATSGQHLGYSNETRTVISWHVPDAELNGLIPEGWEVRIQNDGPHQGANFFLVLSDQIHFENGSLANGISDIQATVWTSPAAGNGMSGFMVLGGMITPRAAPGDYGVFLPATIEVRRSTEERDGVSLIHEEWDVRSEEAEDIRIRLTYARLEPNRVHESTRTFSRIDPEIQRLYEYDEDEVVLFSRTRNVERLEELEVDAAGSPLAEYLTGSPELVGVVTNPWMRIETSLP
jgi:hypothetical protein